MPTAIEWTNETWNPVRARLRSNPARIGWYCEHKSPGCINCYAETLNLAGRSMFTGTKLPYKPGHRKDVEIFLDEKVLRRPLSWRAPKMVFPCSMTDLFADFVTDAMLDRIFAVIAATPQHTYQILTKRPDRMRAYVHGLGQHVEERLAQAWRVNAVKDAMHDMGFFCSFVWPLANVWLGTSVEDQERADERIPILLDTPAAVRWLSMEPLLGPIDLEPLWGEKQIYRGDNTSGFIDHRPRLDWIVLGGESGPRARPMHPDWARSVRDQCINVGVPFLFKQWGAWFPGAGTKSQRWVDPDGLSRPAAEALPAPGAVVMSKIGKKAAGRELDGRTYDEYPEAV